MTLAMFGTHRAIGGNLGGFSLWEFEVFGPWTRPPIVLNQWRAYDAMMGSFAQPDQGDTLSGSRNPEGYMYGMNNPMQNIDPDGWRARPGSISENYNVNVRCYEDLQKIELAVSVAVMKVFACTGKDCLEAQQNYRLWVNKLMYTEIKCPQGGETIFARGGEAYEVFVKGDPRSFSLYSELYPKQDTRVLGLYGHLLKEEEVRPSQRGADEGWPAFSRYDGSHQMWLSPKALKGLSVACLSKVIAHEAMHGVVAKTNALVSGLGSLMKITSKLSLEFVLMVFVLSCDSPPHGRSYQESLRKERDWQRSMRDALFRREGNQVENLYVDRCGALSGRSLESLYPVKCLEFALTVECAGFVFDPETKVPAECERVRVY